MDEGRVINIFGLHLIFDSLKNIEICQVSLIEKRIQFCYQLLNDTAARSQQTRPVGVDSIDDILNIGDDGGDFAHRQ